jgi:hypothetical protein
MTIMGVARPAAVLLLVLGVAACAQRPAGTPPPTDATPPPSAELSPDDGPLVLRVERTGGFVTPETQASRLPIVSAYADGRVLLEGPMAAIHPASAWPNIQVLDIGREGVQELADRALGAGVAETDDLGMPPLADAPSTRFTLVTADGTHVREVYGLTETAGMPATGLTDAQEAARTTLRDLFTELVDLAAAEAGQDVPKSWTPAAVAAVVRPWTAPEENFAQGAPLRPVPWPGPALPGEPIGTLPDLGCVVATGEDAQALLDATRSANAATPWVTMDGARWSVLFRPLLPDETGCADLTG